MESLTISIIIIAFLVALLLLIVGFLLAYKNNSIGYSFITGGLSILLLSSVGVLIV